MKAILILTLLLSWGAVPAIAETMRPITLASIQHMDAALVVMHQDGTESRYTPADLEKFPTYRLTTTTPWRTEPADFDGILLSDLLEANGLTDAAAITVEAENEYGVRIPQPVLDALDILVATRVNGEPISRRDRGPIQFVVDSEEYESSPLAREDYLVWMAARIEPET